MSRQPDLIQLRRPLVAWLAVLLALFGALAPTLSHALAHMRGGHAAVAVLDVCTSAGPRWQAPAELAEAGARTVSLIHAPQPAPDQGEAVLALDHCPLCLLAMERAVPARHLDAGFWIAGDGVEPPPLARQVFFFSLFVIAAAPRGPPALS
jgi:hypothetical protein